MLNNMKKIFSSFINVESFSGLLLLILAILAMYMANSPFQGLYESINHFPLSFKLGSFFFKTNLHEFINEGLMALFFFVVGMEVKRELIEGELSSPKKAALPIIAAIGGSVVPAAIYYFFNQGTNAELGWGIPMATDIAFAVGVLSLMSRKVPFALKIFLLCLAIIDDILAVLVIALFYSETISGPFLALACLVCFGIYLHFKLKLDNAFLLTILSVALWVCIYNSGIHSTLSGVLLGLLIPIKNTNLNLKKLIHLWHPYVSYLIIPLFAFANAGISLKDVPIDTWMNSRITYGIIAGLFFGKPIGIALFSYIGQKLKIAQLPEGIDWKQIISLGFLAGIGFTMSLFITNLSFTPMTEFHSLAKLSVLVASISAGIAGLFLLSLGKTIPKTKRKKAKS